MLSDGSDFWAQVVNVLFVCFLSPCLFVRSEVSRHRGDPPAADETADQRLLPFNRGHPCPSGTGRLDVHSNMAASILLITLHKYVKEFDLHDGVNANLSCRSMRNSNRTWKTSALKT